jgi:hypothetical protein
MRFTKEFNLSVRCVRCGAKLDCVLEDGAEKYDFVVLVDGHNCVGGRTPRASRPPLAWNLRAKIQKAAAGKPAVRIRADRIIV